MIFITLGTVRYDFGRAVKAINILTDKYTKEKFIIQCGKTEGIVRRKNTYVKDFFTRKKIEGYYKSARIVISHAGEGSILQAAVSGVVAPVFIPRNHEYGEHVDDQQIKIARSLDAMGMGITLMNPEKMIEIIEVFDEISKDKKVQFKTSLERRKKLVNNLINYCETI